MGALRALVKTIATVVVGGGIVIASFYFAYLLILLMVMAVIGGIAWVYHRREEIVDWYEFEDSE